MLKDVLEKIQELSYGNCEQENRTENARRKFHEALDSDKKRVEKVLAIFREIYLEERRIKQQTEINFEQRKTQREQKIKPLLTQIREWVDQQQHDVLLSYDAVMLVGFFSGIVFGEAYNWVQNDYGL